MILEQAILNIKPEESIVFEKAFAEAQKIISSMPGFVNLDLLKCIEETDKYLLLVKWESIEDHTIGFRQSEKYNEWKQLLHHFYDPFPVVEHYETVISI
ncbi:antibiotic biosynthesis monooxygenase [Aquimarina litoralis]|uniref:Antibiotic biosynthesis monooxygenase n=1 Tax=Aquimarina litoralis TaxID=584605 RepID=A0ABP3TQ86_9FLAO